MAWCLWCSHQKGGVVCAGRRASVCRVWPGRERVLRTQVLLGQEPVCAGQAEKRCLALPRVGYTIRLRRNHY